MPTWTPKLDTNSKPIYLAIVEALVSDISGGTLLPGTQLPPQRQLADHLGVDFTTISRAYAEGRRRGLIEAAVGRGTFVKSVKAVKTANPKRDLGMNQPPVPNAPHLGLRVAQAWQTVGQQQELGDLLRYQHPGGTETDRAAGVEWLKKQLPEISTDSVMLFPGTQSALTAIIGHLTHSRKVIAAETLCYPGIRALGALLGLRVIGIAMDHEGILPASLGEICEKDAPAAIYLNPTLHNPTTSTLSSERRIEVIEIARRHRIPLIEDDIYSYLSPESPPPLASLAPDLTYHVSGLAKCVSPALRIAYVVAPDRHALKRLTFAARATTGMMPPFLSSLAAHWITTGLARDMSRAIAEETIARSRIATDLLPAPLLQCARESFHAWLTLPPDWTRNQFVDEAQEIGLYPVASDAFSLGQAPEAVRLSLGAPETRAELSEAMSRLADLLARPHTYDSLIV
ncbi:PLP-dependent aminotransferase family protein [Roseibium sp. RKSG952]|uniref:aminotransferase-like domain-containing protein n=1 Tax=Roseibium sp. RKSG952 TaxID=2529384 RepID=UPI0012BCBDFE|nr:PLP-dependent aminotransferase family protein [Roseibium sp. RKSG952]MTH98350.1 PLP-dependent aminotransferase family protein [Roseibium sp. RKSG952]